MTAEPDESDSLPVVAIVGRPNVGKSSLMNRILGRREAIVEATPGVTRDRRTSVAEWRGSRFELVDTGGLEPGQHGLEADVAAQAAIAIDAADVILFVVDASVGPLEDDSLVAASLRRSGKAVLLAANKVDDPRDATGAASAFYRLGLGEPHQVSALHGAGSGDLLDALVDKLPGGGSARGRAPWAAMAIVGRPNVGKSSILNALVGATRAVVAPTPGTTRDPVDAVVELDQGRSLRIVDTAGMRRQVQIKDPIEYFGWLRARQTLQRVDAALLVVDATEGVTGHDQRIAEEIVDNGRACVVALNKWDAVVRDDTDRLRSERAMAEGLRFLSWAPRIRTSALTGRGIDKLVPALGRAVGSHRRRLTTAAVNRLLRDAQARQPHARAGGRAVRVLYGVQARVSPPTVLLFTNGRLEASYLRFVENRLRASEAFEGSPVKLEVRTRSPSDLHG
ncbi:MAG: ribosome biogenesis GTPase Der [Actinomycetota bacterium]